ncbi:MAG: FtsB family cell division protein [Limisphaerales bacterium]
MIVFLIFALALVVVFLWYTPVIQQNERMRQERLELDKKIEKETESAKKLDASLRALQDPRTVERLARENLNYAKPGEIVIHFKTPATNDPSK